MNTLIGNLKVYPKKNINDEEGIYFSLIVSDFFLISL
jgi:hypothetical protein